MKDILKGIGTVFGVIFGSGVAVGAAINESDNLTNSKESIEKELSRLWNAYNECYCYEYTQREELMERIKELEQKL